jgi:hypothetical protein
MIMENKIKIKKIFIGLLIAFICSLCYILKLSLELSDTQESIKTINVEKQKTLLDLQSLKATYDLAIADKTKLSDELIKERNKVNDLMKKINEVGFALTTLKSYKTEYLALQNKMKSLIAQNEFLKKQNIILTNQRDSTVVILGETKKYNEVLVGENQTLSKTVEKASKLNIINLKTAAYKIRNSGKQIATEKASNTNILKISFTIAGNEIAKSGDKTYYVQVIDSKINVIGEGKTIVFGDDELTYSFAVKVKYENKTIDVSEDLAWKNFESGIYFITIYDKSDIVAKTSFTLK